MVSKWRYNLLSIFIIIISFSVLYGIGRASDNSMRPGIGDGDLVLTYKLNKHFSQNDLTIYKSVNGCEVRRVVACEGDTIDIKNNRIVINGYEQNEQYAVGPTYAYKGKISFPLTLKKSEVFLMADSRENASDSRDYGPVKSSDTLGVVMVVIRHRGL